ncbi:DUF2628 domain-containing protein [Flaviaesturariibacter flavus]|uniref:DUF2628 domain-containing protein n=1 Tax=Flaviaesturariibacter flavus TaxID=2502780 RepID=A0A4R1BME6_9BACT|nr:DUF2628 domain-containing protein [Flaviaesturariibacter flavus]TCJ18661.1 DUF2628 domain-containing protein [Flaviaesturariibacter flavus]
MPAAVITPTISEYAAYENFFGKDSRYYLNRLERYQRGERYIFNGYAFLFGFFWFLYRKLYLEAIVLIGLLVVESILEELILDALFPEGGGRAVSWLFNLAVWTATGFLANMFYLRKAKRVVASVQELDAVSASERLARKGGISYWFLLPIVLVITAIIIYSRMNTEY